LQSNKTQHWPSGIPFFHHLATGFLRSLCTSLSETWWPRRQKRFYIINIKTKSR